MFIQVMQGLKQVATYLFQVKLLKAALYKRVATTIKQAQRRRSMLNKDKYKAPPV